MERDFSVYCPYCHKYTSLTIPDSYNAYSGSRNSGCECITKVGNESWYLGVCNSCYNVTLIHRNQRGALTYAPTPIPEPVDERIPDFIRSGLMEAKLCFSLGAMNATAMLCRRAIELICLDKETDTDMDLYHQIDQLLANRVITEDMSKWAHAVRLVGNDVAHPMSTKVEDVQEDDSKDILELANQMAYTLYVAPAIAEEQKRKREQKKKGV